MNHDFLPVHLIQTFVAFVESANITEAAGKIGLSQPAVSVHLRKFEEMLPETVFEMRGKRKVLSPYGQSIYDVVAPEFHKVVRRFSEASRGEHVKPSEVIRIGGLRSLTSLVVPQIQGLEQSLTVDLKETEVLGELQSGRIHYGIVQNQVRLKGVRCETLHTVEFDLVAHELVLPDPPTSEWLAKTPFYAHVEHIEPTLQFLRATFGTQTVLEKVQIYSDWLAIFQAVNNNEGCAVIPKVDETLSKHIQPVKLIHRHKIDLYVLSLEMTSKIKR